MVAYDALSIRALSGYASSNGWSWAYGSGPSDIVRQYNITRQGGWVGIGGDGAIVDKGAGYGSLSGTSVLDALREVSTAG